jgi:hypothetical protein
VRLVDVRWAEARRLFEADGLTISQVAARMGVHPETVRRRALAEEWAKAAKRAGSAAAASPKRAGRPRKPRTIVGRRELIQRLYAAMDTKLKLMEHRMKAQMKNLGTGEDHTSAADHERDTRAIGAIIKNIAQVKEMQADLDRVAGGQPATAADAELFAEADRFRREIAERLARFVEAAG